jgi:hypothetical protein
LQVLIESSGMVIHQVEQHYLPQRQQLSLRVSFGCRPLCVSITTVGLVVPIQKLGQRRFCRWIVSALYVLLEGGAGSCQVA